MIAKETVRKLLATDDLPALVAMAVQDRRTVTALNRLLFDDDPLIRWRAVTALGRLAREDPWLLEKSIARLVYTMNDDSGSIGWMAPQALGEICANDADLVEDFWSIVVASLERPVFRPGALWAIGRVAPVRPDLVEEAALFLPDHLNDPSPEVRGLACRALGLTGPARARESLERLLTDDATLTIFLDGRLVLTTVGRLARGALDLEATPGR